MSPAIRQPFHRHGDNGDFIELAESAAFFMVSLWEPVQSDRRMTGIAGFPLSRAAGIVGHLTKAVIGHFNRLWQTFDGIENQDRLLVGHL